MDHEVRSFCSAPVPIVSALALVMVFGVAAAQTTDEAAAAKKKAEAALKSEADKKRAEAQELQAEANKLNAEADSIDQAARKFFSGWGIGLVNMRNKTPLVTDATVENGGVVRVREEERWAARVLLETHWYSNWTCQVLCTGPFIGAGLSTENLIDALLFGFVVGSGPRVDKLKPKYNVGIGTGRRFKVKTLGDDIQPNAALPPGETEVRYKKTDITVYPVFFFTLQF